MKYKKVKLGDYFKFEKGLGYKGEYLSEESQVGLIGMDSHEEGGGYKQNSEKPYTGPYKPEHIASTGDVIFAATEQGFGLLASPLMVPESEKFQTFIFSHHVLKAFPIQEGFLLEYLYNMFRVERFRSRAAYGDSGTTVRALPAEVLEEQVVPLPDLLIQHSINEIIAMMDQQIGNNKALSSSLEKLTQTIFKSWFIDFDPVKAKMNGEKPIGMGDETAALFPDSFEESELGLIPKGWEANHLGNLITPKKGRTITKATCVYGGVPVVAGGLQPAYFHNKANVSAPVVTISASGANAGFVRLYLEDIWASDCSFVSREITGQVFYWYLFLSRNQEQIYGMQQGAAQPHIYPSDLMRLKICTPDSIDLISRFEETVSPLFLEIGALEKTSAVLSEIRDSLLPRLISGSLQIPEEMLAS